MEWVSEKQDFGSGVTCGKESLRTGGWAASEGRSRGSGEGCLVNCDDHFPSPWIHWLPAVIFTQTAPLTMFTTINPVTIHGSLVTVRALV